MSADHSSVVPTSQNQPLPRIRDQSLLSKEEVVNHSTPRTQLELLQDRASVLVNVPKEVLRKEFGVDSHELAHEIPEERGAVQTNGPSGVVRDIGWHKSNDEIADPLIAGYTNGELFAYIRRFNKDVFDVKAVPIEVARGLDLNDAWAQDYKKDKLALQLQRIYLTIILGLASFGKQVARLRSWKETRRTSALCAIYFSSWYFNLLIPLVLGGLIAIVSSKEAREAIFPSAPRALVSMATGGLQSPQAGKLGTDNTLTGAPEKQEYEAMEEEAANFISNVRHNLQKAVGMHNKDETEGDPLEGKVPKPIRQGIKAIQAEGSAPGHVGESTDQTQEPMEELIWSGLNPETVAKFLDYLPHVIGEIADNWERFANTISPKPPFSRFAFLRLDAVLAPLFVMSLFVNYYMVYKATGFVIGLLIFGNPILEPAMAWVKQNVPNYRAFIEPKNNILRGVPTNVQLAITLLRIGEAHNTPLPPVPTSKPSDPDQENLIDVDEVPVEGNATDVLEAANGERDDRERPHHEDQQEKPKHPHLSKIVRVFKGNTRATVETKLAIDHGRAALGSEKAKGHLGVLPKEKNVVYAGPSEYKCRFDGKPGWAVITKSPQATLIFTHDDPRPGKSKENIVPVFTIAIEDIKRVKRATAFVSSTIESAARFASDKDLLGSLEIEDETAKTWRLTAVPERDELFNRLVSVGEQRWVNM